MNIYKDFEKLLDTQEISITVMDISCSDDRWKICKGCSIIRKFFLKRDQSILKLRHNFQNGSILKDHSTKNFILRKIPIDFLPIISEGRIIADFFYRKLFTFLLFNHFAPKFTPFFLYAYVCSDGKWLEEVVKYPNYQELIDKNLLSQKILNGIILQVYVIYRKLESRNFCHTGATIEDFCFSDKPCAIKYEDLIIDCPYTVMMKNGEKCFFKNFDGMIISDKNTEIRSKNFYQEYYTIENDSIKIEKRFFEEFDRIRVLSGFEYNLTINFFLFMLSLKMVENEESEFFFVDIDFPNQVIHQFKN